MRIATALYLTIVIFQSQKFAMITYGRKQAKSLGALSLTTVPEGDELASESKSAERPSSAASTSSKGASMSKSTSVLKEVASPRASKTKQAKLPPSNAAEVGLISESEAEGSSADDGDSDSGTGEPPQAPEQPKAPARSSSKGATGARPSVTKLPTPAVSTRVVIKPKESTAPRPAKPVAPPVVKPADSLFGEGFLCPTYISDEFGVDAVFVNTFWDPHGWDKSCGRGRAYSTSLKQPSTNVKAMMKFIRLQRDAVIQHGLDAVSYEGRFSPRGLLTLNTKLVDAQLSLLWDHEYDIDSIRQIFMALLPVSRKSQLGTPDPFKMNKSTMVDALVQARVPFVLFNWMQSLAEEIQVGAYKQRTSCEEARRRYLQHWVYCSDEVFAAREAEALGEVDPTTSDPTRGSPPAPTPLVDAGESFELGPLDEDPAEPGSPVKGKRVVVVKRKGRRHHVSVSPPTTPPGSCGDSPTRSRSRRRSASVSRGRGSRKESRKSRKSRSRSPRRDKSEESRHRRRSSKDSRRSRSSKFSGGRSRSQSPARGRKRSRRSPSSSTSSSSSRSRSSNSRSPSIQSSLTKALKGFVKAAKQKPKKLRSRIEKHLDRLDEGLRSGSYIDPCAYSSAHLISIETKGSSAKDCLTLRDGHLVTDENAAEDVTGAPSSMSALKEGLHFIAQRLMTEKEFKGDVERVADRYRFIRYIESDFAAAQSSEKIPVIKEFLRRVRAERLWCPEIPKQSALFFRAFTAPPTKNIHVDEDGEQISKRRRGRPDKPARGARGGGARGNGVRGGGNRGGGGGGTPAAGMMPNLFSDDERKKNGTCLSRTTKVGVCPSAGKPWECKMDHSCPRCPGRSHIAKNCKLLV